MTQQEYDKIIGATETIKEQRPKVTAGDVRQSFAKRAEYNRTQNEINAIAGVVRFVIGGVIALVVGIMYPIVFPVYFAILGLRLLKML
jgi:hypothetical protein